MATTPTTEVVFDGSAERYVKLEELAQTLSVKPATIADWARRYPNFPKLELPGSIRVRASDVEAWLKNREQTKQK